MAKYWKPMPPKDWNLNVKKILPLLLLLACGPDGLEKDSKPQWVLPQDSMTHLMTDVHLVEGARIGRRTIGDSLPIDVYYQHVWDKYQLNKDGFDSNFSYYSRHPEKMEEIYIEVLERLSAMEAQSLGEASDSSEAAAQDSASAADQE